MNFKKTWKRFFCLSRHNDGFTLVELIVVIAILAILAGVGVPAYNGYIKKANMGADQTLAGEVAHALQLHYYNGNTEGGGYVVLNPEGTPSTADAFGTAAMDAVFGDGWEENVGLKYDGWEEGGSMTNVALEQGLAGVAGTVGASSYLNGSTPEELLTNVTDLTYAATGLFEGMNDYLKYDTIKNNLFNRDPELLQEYCNNFGITTSKDDGGNTIFSSNVTNEQLANLLVFGAAEQITNGTGDSMVTGLVYQYAAYAAFVNSQPDNADAQAAYATLNQQLASDNDNSGKIDSTDVMNAFNNFMNNENIKSDLEAYQQESNPQYINDMTAFLCIMDAVNEASGDVTPEEMKGSDFFNSDKVSGYFDNYIAAADAVSKMDPDQISALMNAAGDSGVTIFLSNSPQPLCSHENILLQ